MIVAIAGGLLFTTSGAQAADSIIDSPMETDPELMDPPSILVFSPKLPPLWLQALARPEVDLQRQAADAIARARSHGMQGLEKCIGPLRKVLVEKSTHPLVRRSVAKALVLLDAKQAAGELFQQLPNEGLAYARIVEPALAKWNYRPARDAWLKRIAADDARPGMVRLAMESLATVNEPKAAGDLWKRAGPDGKPTLRLEAARALGRIQSTGLTSRAKQLAGDRSARGLVNRLVAASLLKTHRDAAAKDLLVQLAGDVAPTVAAIALRRLLELEPARIVPLAKTLLKNRDPNVRLLTVRALEARVSVANLKTLGPILDDVHPAVRERVRNAFIKFGAKREFQAVIFEQSRAVLALESWRGQEQAALVLGALLHKPAAKRLVELLDAQRPEVGTASAWALRKLAIPATLPAMLKRATQQTNAQQMNVAQLAQLLQAFGQMEYETAVPLLWRYIPKNSFDNRLRCAAIWSLGKIDPPGRRAELARLLVGRLRDFASIPPESLQVRGYCAVALARIDAKETLPDLNRFYKSEGPGGYVGLGCRWAIHKLTGKLLPGPKAAQRSLSGWFLQPLVD